MNSDSNIVIQLITFTVVNSISLRELPTLALHLSPNLPAGLPNIARQNGVNLIFRAPRRVPDTMQIYLRVKGTPDIAFLASGYSP